MQPPVQTLLGMTFCEVVEADKQGALSRVTLVTQLASCSRLLSNAGQPSMVRV